MPNNAPLEEVAATIKVAVALIDALTEHGTYPGDVANAPRVIISVLERALVSMTAMATTSPIPPSVDPNNSQQILFAWAEVLANRGTNGATCPNCGQVRP